MARARQSEYERLNGKYLKEGQQLMGKGDYAQASEKFWGAAAEIIKAVGAKRGLYWGLTEASGSSQRGFTKSIPSGTFCTASTPRTAST
jgi:hypothetical protein